MWTPPFYVHFKWKSLKLYQCNSHVCSLVISFLFFIFLYCEQITYLSELKRDFQVHDSVSEIHRPRPDTRLFFFFFPVQKCKHTFRLRTAWWRDVVINVGYSWLFLTHRTWSTADELFIRFLRSINSRLLYFLLFKKWFT